ncbi:MAG TPA: pseudouridine synthase [Rhodanobacter sp.]
MTHPTYPFSRDPSASTVHLPPGPWTTVLDALCAHFQAVDRAQWADRVARGRVLDRDGAAISAKTAYHPGMRVHYYREVPHERAIPFVETVLHADDHLVVVDKPHFLPVIPAGDHLEQTLLRRLVKQLGNRDLVPLHRIDRLTAGLVLFSAQRSSRSTYQALFRERRIDKRYEALAPPLPEQKFPLSRHSRLVAGEPFFRMREIDGEPNSLTRIDVLERGVDAWRYALFPVTGRKHQLRVHMAALGAPIVGDSLYPTLAARGEGHFENPLKLLAQALAFVDPLSGESRRFESSLML